VHLRRILERKRSFIKEVHIQSRSGPLPLPLLSLTLSLSHPLTLSPSHPLTLSPSHPLTLSKLQTPNSKLQTPNSKLRCTAPAPEVWWSSSQPLAPCLALPHSLYCTVLWLSAMPALSHSLSCFFRPLPSPLSVGGSMAWPMMISTFLQLLMTMSSLAFVGRLGETALASASIATAFANVVGHIVLVRTTLCWYAPQ